jgi:hypothetical protein
MRSSMIFMLLALIACVALAPMVAPVSALGAKPAVLYELRRGSVLPSSQALKRFACVQPPSACSSNSDCTCSNCCAQFGDQQVCQPSC